MRLSLKNCSLYDEYEVINDKTLSFKDKVLKYCFDSINFNGFECELYPDLSGIEVENFKKRLEEAKYNNEKVLVVSDYDCDGVLSLVIFTRLLDYLKINYNYYIPSRIKEGYGISEKIVEMAKNYHFDLIITLDNGVVANSSIFKANEYNIDMMIIDHHKFEKRPNVKSLIHPLLLSDCFEGMCSGGLSYMVSRLYYDDEYSNILAMITTIADVCNVLKANRYILKTGLNKLNTNHNKYMPIYNLVKKNKYSYDDIAFQLIPRINAISRMDHLTNVNILAKYFKDLDNINIDTANQINKINELRKNISKEMVHKASSLLTNNPIEVIYDETFLEGLCGLAANQLVNDIKRPCIILSKNGDIVKGSGRAVDGFDIYSYFDDFKANFINFGGHKKAIGLSMSIDNIDNMKKYIENHKVVIDKIKDKLIVIDESELNNENVEFIEGLRPFGEGFIEPLFMIVNPVISRKFMIKSLYPKYTLKDGVEAIAFDKRLNQDDIKAIIGKLGFNSYGGKKINISIEEIVI